jgi:uncharacterized protein (DUF305 family)
MIKPRIRPWAVAIMLLGVFAMATPATANAPRSKAEREFLVGMIGHHSMAVAMAEMAVEKGTHQELKAMADEIVRTQTAESRQMRRWLRSWYGRRVGEDHMGHDQDMQTLEEATGPEFEVRFMVMMSVHHAEAIAEARAVRKSRIHPQVRRLTRDIITTQGRDIEQLQDWLVDWYAN